MIIFRTRSDGALCRGSDGVRGATGGWMKNSCVCFLLWGIGWCISWYPVVFAACLSLRLPVCLSASTRGNDILHLPLDLHRSPSVCLSLAALLSLSSPPFISHFAPSCHSVICLYQHHFSLLSHPPSPFFSSLTHPPLFFCFSWSECEEVSALQPSCGSSSSGSKSVGGVFRSNIFAVLKKKRGDEWCVELQWNRVWRRTST